MASLRSLVSLAARKNVTSTFRCRLYYFEASRDHFLGRRCKPFSSLTCDIRGNQKIQSNFLFLPGCDFLFLFLQLVHQLGLISLIPWLLDATYLDSNTWEWKSVDSSDPEANLRHMLFLQYKDIRQDLITYFFPLRFLAKFPWVQR